MTEQVMAAWERKVDDDQFPGTVVIEYPLAVRVRIFKHEDDPNVAFIYYDKWERGEWVINRFDGISILTIKALCEVFNLEVKDEQE